MCESKDREAEDEAGNCERCTAQLYGHLGVIDREVGGVAVITITEVSPRNWICCDACAVMLCHQCCRHPQSGYCDDCIARFGLEVGTQSPPQPQPQHQHEPLVGNQPPVIPSTSATKEKHNEDEASRQERAHHHNSSSGNTRHETHANQTGR